MVTTRNDTLLYGSPRAESVQRILHAGPVSLKFADGELRYLYVEKKEILRRVYFGVRDSRWDTVMPVLTNVVIDSRSDSFSVTFDAVCRNDIADYQWKGSITGNPDGRVEFAVEGAASSDFNTPRLGINILFGSGSLAGQNYVLIDGKDTQTPGQFPKDVQYDLLADFNSFQSLRYKTESGMIVTSGLDTQCIGMEDQRNFGDSSYKAFSSMPYHYPLVHKGEIRKQIFTLSVAHPSQASHQESPVVVKVGDALTGRKIPRFVSPGSAPRRPFRDLNHQRIRAKTITVGFNPALHIPDADTFMENVPTLFDWGHSLRSFAPKETLRMDPICFDSPYPRPGPDPRNNGLFAAAWTARVIKYLALGEIDEAGFAHADSYAGILLDKFKRFAGVPMLDCTVSEGRPPAIDAFALEKGGERYICIINLTDQKQSVLLEGASVVGEPQFIGGSALPSTKSKTLDMPPYEVALTKIKPR